MIVIVGGQLSSTIIAPVKRRVKVDDSLRTYYSSSLSSTIMNFHARGQTGKKKLSSAIMRTLKTGWKPFPTTVRSLWKHRKFSECLWTVWKFGRSRNSCGNTRLRLVSPQLFSFSQTYHLSYHNFMETKKRVLFLKTPQMGKHCCGDIYVNCFRKNVSPFVRASNICWNKMKKLRNNILFLGNVTCARKRGNVQSHNVSSATMSLLLWGPSNKLGYRPQCGGSVV